MFVTLTPRRVAASTSTESTPTPKWDTTFNFGSFARVASSMPFVPVVATAVILSAREARNASRSFASQSLWTV